MPKKFASLTTKDSTELIIYQIGEVKNLVENMSIKFDNYKDGNDKRVSDLEKAVATQLALNDERPRVDIQKIILGAFSIISGMTNVILYLAQR